MTYEHLPLDKIERWDNSFIENSNPHSYVKALLHYFCETLMHTHDFYEINFVMHGNGKYYHDEACIDATVGDVFITPPDIYHGYLKNTDFYIYNLCIHKDFFEYYKKEIDEIPAIAELIEGVPYMHRLNQKSPFALHISNQNLAFFRADLDLIVQTSKSDSPSNEYVKNIITLKILTHLSILYTNQCEKWKKKKENVAFASIMETINYMKANLAEKITIEKLASIACMSRSSYIRNFKMIFNISPIEHLKNLRIEHAHSLISTGKYSKSYIAQECGFYDVAHMGKYI